VRFRAGGPTRAAAWPFTGDKHPSPDHTHQPTAGDTAWNSAPSTVRVHNGWIRRIGRWVVVIGTALVSGVITLALSTWGDLFVVPSAVQSSCSTVIGSSRTRGLHHPESWRWLLLAIVVAGAAAGGIGMAHLIKRRRRSQDQILPPGVPLSH
jgi:hypothetical protein